MMADSSYYIIPNVLIIPTKKSLDSPFPILQLNVDTISVRCYYCDRITPNYYVPFHPDFSHANFLSNLTKFLKQIDTENFNVPVYLSPTKFTKILDTSSDELAVSLFNQAKQAVSMGIVSFRSMHNFLHNNLVNIDVILIIVAFPSNYNLTFDKLTWCYQDDLVCNRMMRNIPQIMKDSLKDPHFLPMLKHFDFITCGGGSLSGVDFYGFISPFDLGSWSCIVIFFFGVGLFALLVSKYVMHNVESTVQGNPFYLGVKVLLEQGDDVALNSKRLGYMYFICAPWILTAIIISTAYRGQNITDLTAPLKPVGISTWAQLKRMEPALFKCVVDTLFHKVTLFEGYSDIFGGKKTFVDVLEPCKKVAYVGWSDELEKMEVQLIMKGDALAGPISKAKKSERLFKSRVGWEFLQFRDRRFYKRLVSLGEAGIVDEWRRMYDVRDKARVGFKQGSLATVKF
ncbi:hypothetical protein Fcan01_26964 [Folsomia candida]|uniref:Uncharacterized protein n=1 Tax=Folsomia candida TaxID=158441 RepID=A0A226CXW7_FOLCA|nr:hypothetical protein Fcan01_26964 [Folsomia candida]